MRRFVSISPRTKQRIGGGMLLLVVGFFFKEVFSWLVGRLLDFATGGWSHMDWSTLPWANLALTVTGVVGAYLAFWPDSTTRQMDELAEKAYRIVARVREHRLAVSTSAEIADPLYEIVADASSLLLTFAKQGFAVPALSHADLRGTAFATARYFQALAPLLRDGHWREARAASDDFARRAAQEA